MPNRHRASFRRQNAALTAKASPCSTRRCSHDHPDGRGAAELLDTLHRAGYAAYVVGGCVRDSLLGLTPMTGIFAPAPCRSRGWSCSAKKMHSHRPAARHRDRKAGRRAATRSPPSAPGTYTDGRHPDEVHFVPDVRRIWPGGILPSTPWPTMKKRGLVDPFGGQADLQSGILRAVGVPHQRFTEDALRILRLYRFAARFGFPSTRPTAQAAQAVRPSGLCIGGAHRGRAYQSC